MKKYISGYIFVALLFAAGSCCANDDKEKGSEQPTYGIVGEPGEEPTSHKDYEKGESWAERRTRRNEEKTDQKKDQEQKKRQESARKGRKAKNIKK